MPITTEDLLAFIFSIRLQDKIKLLSYLEREDIFELLQLPDDEELEKHCDALWLDIAAQSDLPTEQLKPFLDVLAQQKTTTSTNNDDEENTDEFELPIVKVITAQNYATWTPLMLFSLQMNFEKLQLLIAYLPSKKVFDHAINIKNRDGAVATDFAQPKQLKEFLTSPDCWRNCRWWNKLLVALG